MQAVCNEFRWFCFWTWSSITYNDLFVENFSLLYWELEDDQRRPWKDECCYNPAVSSQLCISHNPLVNLLMCWPLRDAPAVISDQGRLGQLTGLIQAGTVQLALKLQPIFINSQTLLPYYELTRITGKKHRWRNFQVLDSFLPVELPKLYRHSLRISWHLNASCMKQLF